MAPTRAMRRPLLALALLALAILLCRQVSPAATAAVPVPAAIPATAAPGAAAAAPAMAPAARPATPAPGQPVASPAPAAARLTPAEARGKQLYLTGTSPAGHPITATLGEAGAGAAGTAAAPGIAAAPTAAAAGSPGGDLVEVPASTLPCAGCHGRDGRGGREGGVRPSDLTWETLARPGAGEADGRRHPPYDESLLVRAITLGIDPAGNRLHVAMPRYRLALQDAADLVAYLKRLGHDDDPGLTADAIALGVLLPGGDRPEAAAEAAAVRAVLEARFAQLDREGGVYGRRLEPHFARLPDPPAARAAALRELLAREPPFALVGAYLTGAEAEMAAAVAEAAVPLVGPLTPHPRQEFPLNRYVFYLTPGLAEQATALVEFAARQLPRGDRTLVILRPAAGELADLAGVVAAAAKQRGFTSVETIAANGADGANGAAGSHGSDTGDDREARVMARAGRLARGGETALLLLDSGRGVRELLLQAQAHGWRPLILLPASLPGEDAFSVVPAALADRLFLSLPLLPPDRTPGGVSDYRRLAAAYPLPAHHVAAQVTALAAAEVLIEGLKRVGRDLSREQLISALERLYQFDAGLGTPVSFGPNRRVGALGAYVAALDFAHHALGRETAWIDLEP